MRSDQDPKLTKAQYSLKVNGAEVDPLLAKRIREIRIDNYRMLPDVCTFTLGFPKARPDEPAPIDSHPFKMGAVVEVGIGARTDPSTTPLFKGDILTLEPSFGGGAAEMIVRAFDKAHILQRGRKTVMYQNQKASDIAGTIAANNGLAKQIDDTRSVLKFMQQDNESDWDFLWRLADRIGFVVYVDSSGTNPTLHFEPQKVSDPIPLEWPDDLSKFSPRVTAVQQVSSVDVRSYDHETKKALVGHTEAPRQIAEIGITRQSVKNPAKVLVANQPVGDQGEANKIAQALLDRLANGYVAAEGETTDGNPKIKAGCSIEVSGVGTQFSGVYLVTQCSHVVLGGTNYSTRFANSPLPTITSGPGSNGGRVPVGSQLMIGIVTNNNDPDGLGRVRVKYPVLDDSLEGWWARVAVPSAGQTRGLSMLPVPEEEVLVAFEHGDTRRPLVLGSLFNKKDKPGTMLAAKDGSFGLLSDEKIEMHAKKDITITSGSDASTGLTIKVEKDVSEKFGGKFTQDTTGAIEIKGGAAVTISATSSLTIKGMGITIDGGGGGVKISGSTVKIG